VQHIPDKLRKREGEKYMIDILNDPTKWAEAIGRAVTDGDLLARR
jgi:hypothetical protein